MQVRRESEYPHWLWNDHCILRGGRLLEPAESYARCTGRIQFPEGGVLANCSFFATSTQRGLSSREVGARYLTWTTRRWIWRCPLSTLRSGTCSQRSLTHCAMAIRLRGFRQSCWCSGSNIAHCANRREMCTRAREKRGPLGATRRVQAIVTRLRGTATGTVRSRSVTCSGRPLAYGCAVIARATVVGSGISGDDAVAEPRIGRARGWIACRARLRWWAALAYALITAADVRILRGLDNSRATGDGPGAWGRPIKIDFERASKVGKERCRRTRGTGRSRSGRSR